ncbi:hypothetical protein CHISP_0420 [Chitinispirillum alkaliphilum]|nr:hypothetical protein CHISP_0420 [Chitinispirillum alkaliphilum]
MKKYHIFSISIFLFAFLVYGQHSGAGGTAFPFMNINYDARSVAMGGAASAIPNGVYGVLSNPATIGYENNPQVMVGYRPVIMDVWGGPLAYLHPLDEYGNFALNVVILTSGKLETIDSEGRLTGDIARNDNVAGGISWGKELVEDFAVGVTLRGYYTRLGFSGNYYTADGVALDGGVQYRMKNGRFITGAAFRNLGFMRRGFDPDVTYPMPAIFEIGVSYVLEDLDALRFALDINKKVGDYFNFEPGLEFTLSENILLRAGYSMSQLDLSKQLDVLRGEKDYNYQKSNMSSLAIGAGFITNIENVDLNLDVALQFYSDVSRPAIIVSAITQF